MGVHGHWLVALEHGLGIGGVTVIWAVSWKLVSLLGLKCHRYRRPLYGFWSCVMSHPGHLRCLLEYGSRRWFLANLEGPVISIGSSRCHPWLSVLAVVLSLPWA